MIEALDAFKAYLESYSDSILNCIAECYKDMESDFVSDEEKIGQLEKAEYKLDYLIHDEIAMINDRIDQLKKTLKSSQKKVKAAQTEDKKIKWGKKKEETMKLLYGEAVSNYDKNRAYSSSGSKDINW